MKPFIIGVALLFLFTSFLMTQRTINEFLRTQEKFKDIAYEAAKYVVLNSVDVSNYGDGDILFNRDKLREVVESAYDNFFKKYEGRDLEVAVIATDIGGTVAFSNKEGVVAKTAFKGIAEVATGVGTDGFGLEATLDLKAPEVNAERDSYGGASVTGSLPDHVSRASNTGLEVGHAGVYVFVRVKARMPGYDWYIERSDRVSLYSPW